MMLRSILFSGIAAALAATTFPALANPDCICRANGREVHEGQTVCLRTAVGMKLARCERVLNNTSWKFSQKPCLFMSLAPQRAPQA